MEEMKKKSGLSVLLNLTNILGLAVIIALSLVIKIILDQKEAEKKNNQILTVEIEEKIASIKDLTTAKTSLETKLSKLKQNQGCDSYIKQLEVKETELEEAREDYIRSLEYTRKQTREISHLTQKVKILEGFIDDNSGFPN